MTVNSDVERTGIIQSEAYRVRQTEQGENRRDSGRTTGKESDANPMNLLVSVILTAELVLLLRLPRLLW